MKTFFVSAACVAVLIGLCAARSVEGGDDGHSYEGNDVVEYLNQKLAPVCISMTPTHEGTVPQTSPAPYTVAADKTRVAPGGTLTMKISGPEKFKGIFCQARDSSGKIVGSFQPKDDKYTFVVSCGSGRNNALFRDYRPGDKEVAVQWKAPDTEETVVFRCTVVPSFIVYWVGVESPEIQVVKA